MYLQSYLAHPPLRPAVSTPDAMRGIASSIHQASQLKHKSALQQLPSRIPTVTKTRAVSRSRNSGLSSISRETDRSQHLLSNPTATDPSHSAKVYSGLRTADSPEDVTGLGSDVISPVTSNDGPFTSTNPQLYEGGSFISTGNRRLHYEASSGSSVHMTETGVVSTPQSLPQPPASTTSLSSLQFEATPAPQMSPLAPRLNPHTPSIPHFKGPSYERTSYMRSESELMKGMPLAHEILASQVTGAC